MVQPHEADLNEVTHFYDSAQTQADAIHFIGHLRNFDKTQDEKFLIDGNGKPIKRFSPKAKPASFEGEIIKALKQL